jgi:uncharacterized protein (DUF952 family)
LTDKIYHITERIAWSEAQQNGEYRDDSLEQDGFIHASKINQVMRVANKYYPGHSGLVILVVDPPRLKADIRWEPGTDKLDELFPHIYGPINLDAVTGVFSLEPDREGAFTLPPDLK